MSKTYYCHEVNKPGLVCIHKKPDGTCMKRAGIFSKGECKWQREYPLLPPSPPSTPLSNSKQDKSYDYLCGFRDGILFAIGEKDTKTTDLASLYYSIYGNK